MPRPAKETCPCCNKQSLGRFLYKDSKDVFGWYCRECKTTLPDANSKPVLKLHKCSNCESQVNYGYSSAKKVKYWRCTKQACGTFYSDKNGEPSEQKDSNNVYKTAPCNKCKDGTLRQFSRRADGKKFWMCSNREVAGVNCQASYDDKNGMPDTSAKEHNCPSCKTGLLKRRAYKNNHFWGCTNWNHAKLQCKFTAKDKNGEPLILLS
jgi:DNA topoisomerase-3